MQSAKPNILILNPRFASKPKDVRTAISAVELALEATGNEIKNSNLFMQVDTPINIHNNFYRRRTDKKHSRGINKTRTLEQFAEQNKGPYRKLLQDNHLTAEEVNIITEARVTKLLNTWLENGIHIPACGISQKKFSCSAIVSGGIQIATTDDSARIQIFAELNSLTLPFDILIEGIMHATNLNPELTVNLTTTDEPTKRSTFQQNNWIS
jgi:hypothetical protein